MKKLQFVIWIIVAIALVLGIGLFVYNRIMMETKGDSYPEVTFELENFGTVKMELYPQYAPNTVANFIKLVESGYYNDKVFFGRDEVCIYIGRTQDGEVVDPTSDLVTEKTEEGAEAYKYEISGEFVANGFEANTLRHEKGIVSLIRKDYTSAFPTLYQQSYDSGNAQIGIMMGEKAGNLNGSYAAFGKIIEGMEIIEKLYNDEVVVSKATTEVPDETANTENTTNTTTNTTTTETANTTAENTTTDGATSDSTETTEDADGIYEFANYPKITSATVDTKGVNYGFPHIHEAFDYETYLSEYMSSMSTTTAY